MKSTWDNLLFWDKLEGYSFLPAMPGYKTSDTLGRNQQLSISHDRRPLLNFHNSTNTTLVFLPHHTPPKILPGL